MRLEELLSRVNNESEEKKIRAAIESKIVDVIKMLIDKRVELNITQKELANRIGMKQEAIARFEAIKVIPKIDTIFKIAMGLDLDLIVIDQLEIEKMKNSIDSITGSLNITLKQIHNTIKEIKYSVNMETSINYKSTLLNSTSTNLLC